MAWAVSSRREDASSGGRPACAGAQSSGALPLPPPAAVQIQCLALYYHTDQGLRFRTDRVMNFFDDFRDAEQGLLHRVLHVLLTAQDAQGQIEHQVPIFPVEEGELVAALLCGDHRQVDQHGLAPLPLSSVTQAGGNVTPGGPEGTETGAAAVRLPPLWACRTGVSGPAGRPLPQVIAPAPPPFRRRRRRPGRGQWAGGPGWAGPAPGPPPPGGSPRRWRDGHRSQGH